MPPSDRACAGSLVTRTAVPGAVAQGLIAVPLGMGVGWWLGWPLEAGLIFGIALSELDASLREEFQIDPGIEGIVVLAVDVGGANEGVLRAGDVIEQMAFQNTTDMIAARAIAGEAAVGEHNIVVRINREGQRTYRRLRARS